MAEKTERTLIGVAERVNLPEWGVARLRAKIDTGAKTSALHVDSIEELPGEQVRFSVVLHRKKRDERVSVVAPISRRGRVRSSTGRVQERIFVRTRLILGGVEKVIEVSLASRGRMIFRMLLGRSALQDDFLVDPNHRYLHAHPPSERPKARKVALRTTRRRARSNAEKMPRRVAKRSTRAGPRKPRRTRKATIKAGRKSPSR